MDDQAWASFRARLRKRSGLQMMLIISPFIDFVAILKILEPMDYPAGDVRNSIALRLAFYGLFIAFAIASFLVWVRSLCGSARWWAIDDGIRRFAPTHGPPGSANVRE